MCGVKLVWKKIRNKRMRSNAKVHKRVVLFFYTIFFLFYLYRNYVYVIVVRAISPRSENNLKHAIR